MELPKRKPNRLKDFDHRENRAYFVTICTFQSLTAHTCEQIDHELGNVGYV